MVSELLPWSRNDWHETTWGELVELKYGKALQDYKEATTGFPVYGTNGAVGFNDKPLCDHPGVIIGRKGAYRGVHYSSVPFFVIDTAFYIEPRFDINLKWAYYELLQQDINGLDSGSAIPSTRREDFYALRVKIPPRYVQDKICVLLDSLNNKINCNRQINQTLEQMAQALFKSWFVDFDPVVDNALDAGFFEQELDLPDELLRHAEARKAVRAQEGFKPLPAATRQLFPAAFEPCVEPSLGLGGWVPKGWEILQLKDLSDKISKGTTPRSSDIELAKGDLASVLFVKVKDMTDDNRVSLVSLESIPKSVSTGVLKRSILSEGDILLSIAGTIGRVASVEKELDGSNCNQAVAFLRPKDKKEHHLFIKQTLQSENVRQYITSKVVQAVQANFSLTHFGEIQIVLPSDQAMKCFNLLATAYSSRVISNLRQIDILTKLRDTLLPKLISGELSLEDVELTSQQGAA